jgi:hypothetical protein
MQKVVRCLINVMIVLLSHFCAGAFACTVILWLDGVTACCTRLGAAHISWSSAAKFRSSSSVHAHACVCVSKSCWVHILYMCFGHVFVAG